MKESSSTRRVRFRVEPMRNAEGSCAARNSSRDARLPLSSNIMAQRCSSCRSAAGGRPLRPAPCTSCVTTAGRVLEDTERSASVVPRAATSRLAPPAMRARKMLSAKIWAKLALRQRHQVGLHAVEGEARAQEWP